MCATPPPPLPNPPRPPRRRPAPRALRSKADAVEKEHDRQRVLIQITQNLATKIRNSHAFNLPTFYLPRDDDLPSTIPNAIEEVCREISKVSGLAAGGRACRRRRGCAGVCGAGWGNGAGMLFGEDVVACRGGGEGRGCGRGRGRRSQDCEGRGGGRGGGQCCYPVKLGTDRHAQRMMCCDAPPPALQPASPGVRHHPPSVPHRDISLRAPIAPPPSHVPQSVEMTVQKNLKQLKTDCHRITARIGEVIAADKAKRSANGQRRMQGALLALLTLGAAGLLLLVAVARVMDTL